MTPAAMLADLRSRGVELETDGQRLRWRPAFLVSAGTQESILLHKQDLIDLLSLPGGAQGPRCPRCGWPLDSALRCVKCFDRPCADCGRPTGSYFVLRCVACGHDPQEAIDPSPTAGASLNGDAILCGDSRALLAELPDCLADLCVTDPPFNVGLDYNAHDDALP